MKEKLRKAYEAGQKSVIGRKDNGYSIDADKRQTFNCWYDDEVKNLNIPDVKKSVCVHPYKEVVCTENGYKCTKCNELIEW
jgi:hypothetical protein